jgi:hypothetical protein
MRSSRLSVFWVFYTKAWSTVIFEEIEQLLASRQKIQRPVLDVLANTRIGVLKPKRPYHVSARATCPRG